MAIKQRSKSLRSRENDLSDGGYQLTVLNNADLIDDQFVRFSDKITNYGHSVLKPTAVEIFQINIGKLCNQSCGHCHVDAGPDQTEANMSRETLETCLEIIERHDIRTVDITGGAPELNPNFRWFVQECARQGRKVMNRCNLTIIVANKKYNDLPEFFAENSVQVISSLPYFSKRRTDSQRGDGVFEDSIRALKMLNKVGYGKEGSGLVLDLVYNPTGTFLPSSQCQLEAEFKRQLDRKFGITFNSLYAITNLPISRFLEYLIESEQYSDYMETLVDAFNPATIDGLMCRNTLSVSWDGYIYDCDFNQMLDLKVASKSTHISNFDIDALASRDIVVNQHCYGCTAGAGSSCGGELV
ncbi:MAG: radical SAM protein [Bacteroidetes bacterium]|nr:MAG: radical SAM protein [Bacteroidota bacterium]